MQRAAIVGLAFAFAPAVAIAQEPSPGLPKPIAGPVRPDATRQHESLRQLLEQQRTAGRVEDNSVDSKVRRAVGYLRLCRNLALDYERLEQLVVLADSPDQSRQIRTIGQSAKLMIGPADVVRPSPPEGFCDEAMASFGPQGTVIVGLLVIKADTRKDAR